MKNILIKKITAITLICTAIFFLGCMSITLRDNTDKESTISNSKDTSPESKGKNEGPDLKKKQSKTIEELNILADKLSKIEDVNLIKSTLNEYYELNKNSAPNLYFAQENGEFYLYPNQVLPQEYDARKREWYLKAIENKSYISELYQDIVANRNIFTVAVRVSKDKTNIGVIGIDKYAD